MDNILIIVSVVNFILPNLQLNKMIFNLKYQDTTTHVPYNEAR